MRSSPAVAFLVATISHGAALATGQPHFDPVPSEWLQGTTLVAEELNVSLQAPADDWQWLMSAAPAEKGPNGFKVLACQNRDGSKMFLVSVHNPYWEPLDEDGAARLTAGVRSGLESNGFTVGASTHERTNIPLPGSDHFTIVATLPDGGELTLYGYSAVRQRLFQFQHASVEPSDPPEFTRFVASFDFVGEVPSRFSELLELAEQFGTFAAGVLLLLTCIVGACSWLVNQLGGRVVVNPWKYWLFFLGFYAVAMSLAWWFNEPDGLEPYDAGRIQGGVALGPVLLPFVFAWWRWRRLDRKRALEVKGLAD